MVTITRHLNDSNTDNEEEQRKRTKQKNIKKENLKKNRFILELTFYKNLCVTSYVYLPSIII